MSTSLVYLRPKPVAYVRVEGVSHEVAELAWRKLQDWCRETQMSGLIKTSYGIAAPCHRAKVANKCAYEAAIEIPFADFKASDHGLAIRQLPGGAYLRRRHCGSRSSMPSALDMIANKPAVDEGLALDPTRPFIEIFLSNPWDTNEQDVTMELLLPISVASRSAA